MQLQSNLVISNSLISNYRLPRSENLVPVLTWNMTTGNKIMWKKYFSESLGLLDNESRLYIIIVFQWIQVMIRRTRTYCLINDLQVCSLSLMNILTNVFSVYSIFLWANMMMIKSPSWIFKEHKYNSNLRRRTIQFRFCYFTLIIYHIYPKYSATLASRSELESSIYFTQTTWPNNMLLCTLYTLNIRKTSSPKMWTNKVYYPLMIYKHCRLWSDVEFCAV